MIKISRYHFSIVLFFHYQHSGIGRYTFFSARKAEFLRGSGLDGDVVLVYAHHSGKRALHFGNMCFQLRTFGTDGGINVAHRITFGSYQFYCFFSRILLSMFLNSPAVSGNDSRCRAYSPHPAMRHR